MQKFQYPYRAGSVSQIVHAGNEFQLRVHYIEGTRRNRRVSLELIAEEETTSFTLDNSTGPHPITSDLQVSISPFQRRRKGREVTLDFYVLSDETYRVRKPYMPHLTPP